jgi:hypothetical protein
MVKLKMLGAICLATALAASPALARDGHRGGGFHRGGTHLSSGGFRGGFAPGIAAGIIAGSVLGGGYGYYAPGYAYEPDYGYYGYPYQDRENEFPTDTGS